MSRFRLGRWGAAFVVLALACRPVLAQTRLDHLRNDTRGDSPAPARQGGSSAGSGGDGSWSWPTGGDFPLEGWLGLALVAGVVGSSPVWVPLVLLNDNFDHSAAFPGRPYALPDGGYLDLTNRGIDNEERHWLDADYLKPWALRVSVEDGNDFNGLNRAGAALNFDTTSRFGLSSRWDVLTERPDGGRSDETLLGDVHLTYRMAQATWSQFYLGAGARWLIDSHRKTAGFSALYGADFFPLDPVIISTELDVGHLGSAFAIRGRVTLGVRLGSWEAFGGYDHQRIGDVRITGPLLGVRRWF
jgi:hypothetical protein